MNSARLNDLLKNVSRSFYLTLRVLPGAVRPQIGLAYLLARATDTIADTDIISVGERLDGLRRLRERINHRLGFLRGGRVVQIHQRLAVHLLVQGRKRRPNGGDVERRNYGVHL